MALVLRSIYNWYNWLFHDYEGKQDAIDALDFLFAFGIKCFRVINWTSNKIISKIDPRVDRYPLTQSPMLIISLVAIYVYFVTHWGQRYMKNRPAYDLKNIIKVYNLIQIAVNLFIGVYVSGNQI